MSHCDHFREAIAAAGLTAPDNIIDDGKLHRFSSNGKPRDESGWYKLHGDDRPAGAFGCWRAQIQETWKSSSPRKEYSAADKLAWKTRMQQVEREREEILNREREACALQAAEWMLKSVPATDHPYLTAKDIPAPGARVLNGELLIPVKLDNTLVVGLQRILPDGQKFFLRGTPMALGGYHVIGKPTRTGPIAIVEGYATGVTVQLATGYCTVVAFNAGNLSKVALKIRKALPDALIIMGADDDDFTVRTSGEAWNPGIEAATAAAAAIGANIAIPVWSGKRDLGTDFNDLFILEGLEAVAACFANAKPPEIREAVPVKQPVEPVSDGSPSAANNTGSSAGEFPPFASGAAVTESPDQPQTGSGDDVEDILIFSATPMKTAEVFQENLPADGKVLFWRGEYYTWNGHRYVVRDTVYLHQLLYNFMARCVTHKTDPKTGDKEVVGFSPKKSAVEDVMHALKAVCFVDLPEPPSWITDAPGDVPAGEIIAFRNGFLHCPTRTLMPSDSRLFVISALDFNYDPQAPAPTEWLKFLATMWAHDPESISALADMFGYMLTDDTSQQKAFMMIGPPRCGKGTILRVLENMVGQHNRVSPSLASLGTQFGLQPLVGKRLAMISDARLSGKTDQQPIVENILRITGEDSLSVDRKFLGSWSGKLSTRFVLASNETPAFSDASGALANRFVMFKFTLSFLGSEDHGLTARLLKELPGIVLWALDGLDALRARGYLQTPSSGRELSDEMREQSSPISSFVAEKCLLKDGLTIERVELFTAWKEWCNAQGMEHPGTVVSFGRRLSAAVAGIGRSQPRASGTRLNCYTGIRLRSHLDDDEPY